MRAPDHLLPGAVNLPSQLTGWWGDLEAPTGRDADLAYIRVADDIAADIASGKLAPGVRLRAERELAKHYGVAYGTVRHAIQELRSRGMIRTVPGRGTFIASHG